MTAVWGQDLQAAIRKCTGHRLHPEFLKSNFGKDVRSATWGLLAVENKLSLVLERLRSEIDSFVNEHLNASSVVDLDSTSADGFEGAAKLGALLAARKGKIELLAVLVRIAIIQHGRSTVVDSAPEAGSTQCGPEWCSAVTPTEWNGHACGLELAPERRPQSNRPG